MAVEFLLFSLNLGLFTALVWNILSLKSIKLSEKIPKIILFLIFGSLFYLVFFINSYIESQFFALKEYFFNLLILSGILSFLAVIMIVFRLSYKAIILIMSFFLGPYLFFLLFGVEDFQLVGDKLQGLSLLKTQNPIIFLVCLFILVLKWNKIQIPLFLGSLLFLYLQVKPLQDKALAENAENVHFRLIPFESFLKGHSLFIEESSGIYTHKIDAQEDEILYKFTMRPVKNIKPVLRQNIQKIVSKLEFPIVLKEENVITILELSRTYRGETFRVVLNLETENWKLEGPLF